MSNLQYLEGVFQIDLYKYPLVELEIHFVFFIKGHFFQYFFASGYFPSHSKQIRNIEESDCDTFHFDLAIECSYSILKIQDLICHFPESLYLNLFLETVLPKIDMM